MLVLTYAADRRRKNELQRLEDSGVSVIVRTTDPNVTPQLVSRLFGIDTASVGVLDSRLGSEYQKLVKNEIPRADALVATKGRMESMMNVISACVEERRTVGMVVAIQNGRRGAVLCVGGFPGLLWGHGPALLPDPVLVPAVLAGSGHPAAQAAAVGPSAIKQMKAPAALNRRGFFHPPSRGPFPAKGGFL